jgi:hypothetical protein
MVLYADDRSFYMTPGRPPLRRMDHLQRARAGRSLDCPGLGVDPVNGTAIYEAGFMAYGNRAEDKMWQHTLRELARHLGSPHEPTSDRVKVDKKRVWRNFGNIRHNAMLTGLFRRKAK